MCNIAKKAGSFADSLINGAADSLTGGLASGVSGLVSGLIGMIGSKKREKRQLENQMKLNEAAAETNYKYGEMAAENAFQRQMEMYQQSYKDQSYSSMRKQMEDAGLSVGMMYGGGGAGGEGGATSGAPQGSTGGAMAGDAAAIMQNELGLQQNAIRNREAEAQIRLAQSQADLNEAKAKESGAAKENTEALTQTLNEIRKFAVESQKQEALKKWLENIQEKLKLEGDSDVIKYENKELGALIIVGEDSYSRRMMTTAIDNMLEDTNLKRQLQEYYERLGETQESIQAMNTSIAQLNNEKVRYVALEAYSDYIRAIAEYKNANTNEYNAEVEKQFKNGVLKINKFLANLKREELLVDIQKFETKNGISFGEALLKAVLTVGGVAIGATVAGPAGAAVGGATMSIPMLYNADGSKAMTAH